jgi:hypothetical protein
MVDHLSGALKSTLDEVGVVRAEAARAAVAADDAARLAQLALEEVRAGAGGRLRRARLDAAVQHITSAIRRHCAREGRPYQAIYSEVRRELGLRRTQDGGPALGRAKLDARQILTLARVASQLGVPGVGARVVERIMTGEDDLRAQGPGGRDVVDAITPEPKRPAQPLLLEAFGLGCAS